MLRRPVHRLRRLVRDPLGGAVYVPAAIADQQMCVRRLNRCSNDRPLRLLRARSNRDDNRIDHDFVERHRLVEHPLLCHALTSRVAFMKRVWLDVSDHVIPRIGPRSTFIARQP